MKKSRLLAFVIQSGIAYSWVFTLQASAQNAVIDGSGCGTGCVVRFTQIGTPKKTGEGIYKVLAREVMTVTPAPFEQQKYGWKPEVKSIKVWKFADCNKSLFGQGYSSNPADVEMRTIYDEQGNPEHRTFSSNIYSQWEALCKAGSR